MFEGLTLAEITEELHNRAVHARLAFQSGNDSHGHDYLDEIIELSNEIEQAVQELDFN